MGRTKKPEIDVVEEPFNTTISLSSTDQFQRIGIQIMFYKTPITTTDNYLLLRANILGPPKKTSRSLSFNMLQVLTVYVRAVIYKWKQEQIKYHKYQFMQCLHVLYTNHKESA